jgi:hypothetical protein
MNENWSVPRVIGHSLRILFRTQYSFLDRELRFYSAKERRDENSTSRQELPEQTRLRFYHHHRHEE